jgi:uncharacterized protein YdhG (YjbR/CyaY superfamily)
MTNMQSKAKNASDYLKEVPEDRAPYFKKLRDTVVKNIPKGFEECIQYGMISYVVPHSIFPDGYHCDPKTPLPFISIASQKNFIALHHMGIYANPKLLDWFVTEYPKYCKTELDMGKGCIRFKKADQIPFDLVAELVQKIAVKDWIKMYQDAFVKSKK